MDPELTKLIAKFASEAYDENGCLLHRSPKSGQSRCVVIRNNVAIKFALRAGKEEHNRREWEVYHRAPSAQPFLAKPLAISSCGRVMAMELVTILSEIKPEPESAHERRELSIQLAEALSNDGLDDNSIFFVSGDDHDENIGVTDDGRSVFVDYAGAFDVDLEWA